MASYSNVLGTYHKTYSTMVNINGVWREAIAHPNIDGVWRETDKLTLTADDILGFRMVYSPNPKRTYPGIDHLKFNPDIPARLMLTGDISGNMSYEYKGVIFEYTNEDEPDKEGILMYEGVLYAVLLDNTVVDVCATIYGTGQTDRFYNRIGEIWASSKFNTLSIQLQGRVSYESNGFNFEGWNKFFQNKDFIGKATPANPNDKNYLRLNSYNILPIPSREENFYPMAEIGIARDMHTVGRNMVGSYGNVDHTIDWITVNGIKKPFVCEIYN